MKINSINPLIVTSSPEEILPLYVKGLGFKITHNLELNDFNLLVLENGKSKIDVVVDADPKKKRIFPIEYYATRINVDNLDNAIKTLLAAGCTPYINTIEVKSAKGCLLKQPNGLLIGVIEHKKANKKKAIKKEVKKKIAKKQIAKKAIKKEAAKKAIKKAIKKK